MVDASQKRSAAYGAKKGLRAHVKNIVNVCVSMSKSGISCMSEGIWGRKL